MAVLRQYEVLDTPREEAFDEIVAAAAKLCGVPISAVSFVDFDRQWFKAEVGLGVRQTSRAVSFCAHAMEGDDLFVVPDATAHPLFADNALVTGDPSIRFYAGAPIRAADGQPLGALCVIDKAPRPAGLDAQQALALKTLARQVEYQLELRNAVDDQARAAQGQARAIAASLDREAKLVSTFDSAEIGWWDWDVVQDRMTANRVLADAYGVPAEIAGDGAPMVLFLANIHPGDATWLQEAIDHAVKTGEPFREEYRLLNAKGEVRWISARGQCLIDEAGQPSRFTGISIDVTDRKRAEDALREANLSRELAMSAARLGRFDHRPAQGRRYYDDRALEMIGLTQAEVQDFANVLALVHPDDRDGLTGAIRAATDPDLPGPFGYTYRVTHKKTGQERWIQVVGRSQFIDRICTRFTGVFEDVTAARLADEHRRLLTNELNHRVKNTLAVVASLVESSLRSLPETEAARRVVAGRIQAFGRAHDLLTADSWSAASIPQIAKDVIASLSLPPERVEASGPPIRLGPQPALQLALALNELATNAMKYGSLSNERGCVALAWRIEGKGPGSVLKVEWTERDGPTVAPPSRRGFGTSLMERATAMAFDGQVELSYPPSGVCWRLTAPLAGLSVSGRATPRGGEPDGEPIR